MSVELTNDQIYAIMDLENWWNRENDQVFEISGKGGTGKTFLVNYFIERIGLTVDEVLFVAFMGKAASVLQRQGLPAKTIHSAIYDYKKKYCKDENGRIIFKSNNKPKTEYTFELKESLPKRIKLIVLDEGSMVDEKMGRDLLSFGIPIVVLGDLNQLPPVFGSSFFLNKPNVILRQIMRQEEGNPIIYLADQVLEGKNLHYGVYGNSAVIRKSDLNEFILKNCDMILTGTNSLRYNINNLYRERFMNIEKLEYPHVGERVICRKNNWNECINDVYLTNGIIGTVSKIYPSSFNGKSMKMDFKAEFLNKPFRNIEFDYEHMYEVPGNNINTPYNIYLNRMEFAYAITCHASQGSSWEKVIFMYEDFMRDKEDKKKLLYTGITRAEKQITIVI